MSDAATASNHDGCNSVDSSGSSRKSVTMIGIALSVAASGLVIQQQDDHALAADHQVSMPSLTNAESGSASSQALGASAGHGRVNHVVREGDTIWSIADRYRVSTDEIVSTNVLSSAEVLRVGQSLDIPVESQPVPQMPSPVESSDSSSQSTNRNLAHLQIQKASESLETDKRSASDNASDASEASLDDGNSVSRVPRAGSINQQSIDRLRNRREELQASMTELQASKPDSSSLSRDEVDSSNVVDQVAVAQQPSESASQLSAALPDAGDRLSASTVQHQAQSGETIQSIALTHGVDLRAIVELNRLSDPDDIQVGQVLLLPADDQPTAWESNPGNVVIADARPSSGNVSSPEDESVQVSALQDDVSPNFEPSSVARPVTYQIRPGETLAEISRRYGISLQELIEQNSIRNPNRVFAGQVLNIPASQQPSADEESAESVSSRPTLRSTPETLVGYATLPGAQFSVTTDVPELVAAPVLPLPSGEVAEPSSDDLQGSADASPDVNTDVDIAAHRTSESINDAEKPSQANVYVEGLLNEIRAIESVSSAPTSVSEVTSGSGGAAAVAPDVAYLQDGDAVNPEFEQSAGFGDRSDSPSQASTEQPPAQPEPSPALVASAPLGSENYAPIGQPATGSVVSPELPPLPGADNYLPNGSATFNGYLWPARGVFTSGYGWRWGRMHRGIDIAAPVGTPIYAAAPGVIEFSGWNSGGYGNMVDIRHPDGSKTRYAHNSRLLVRAGQSVTQGQQIAEMGSTGYSTGPHVHFEIHVPSQGAVNPVALLPAR